MRNHEHASLCHRGHRRGWRGRPVNAMLSLVRERVAFVLLMLSVVPVVLAEDALHASGFALLRASDLPSYGALVGEPLSAQAQLALDWLPSPRVSAHVHLLGRTDEGDERTRRGSAGIVQAYADVNFTPGHDRLRLRGGAFFLTTSRENVDALWESPYTITSSALNSWFGEEFRPIGIDASYFHGNVFGGATVFRGNDTFGALPAFRGWTLDDHSTLLGEWVPVDEEAFTSISAENDGRLGWSARGGWNGPNLFVQVTHLDNRADGLEYGHLYNWGTRFDIAAFEYTNGDWTVAGETGWGPTFIVVDGSSYTTDLRASYLLVSRKSGRARASVRLDSYRGGPNEEEAITLALFWTPRPELRVGTELTAAGDDHRATVEIRYYFGGS